MIPDDAAEDSSSDALRYDWSRYQEPSMAVVEAVAEFLGCDEIDLPPLQDSLETDALNAVLTGHGNGSVRIEFEYAGAWITIDGGGTLLVWQYT